MEILGKYNSATIYADDIDSDALTQLYNMLNIPASENTSIRIMPDVHVGKGSVVGFTMTVGKFVSPTVVGVDIGCGVDAWNLDRVSPDLPELDSFIKEYIPSGRSVNKQRSKNSYSPDQNLIELIEKVGLKEYDRILKGIGTLGGGNHFIELDVDSKHNVWLLIHSGSRYLGKAVFDFHSLEAKKYIKKAFKGAGAYYGNEFLPVNEEEGQYYIGDMKTTQQYAVNNRKVMAKVIVEGYFGMKMKEVECISSIHSYIDFKDQVIRKGAIASHNGQKLVIPMNMRDGILICRGKGNADWNFSAPHGAGRLFSRAVAKEEITMSSFKESMHGIYSSSISESTLDESPMAYKNAEMIKNLIADTVEILDEAKPIYNFKAGV